MTTAGELCRAMGGTWVRGDPRRAVTGAALDTRTLARGEAFFAVRGARTDGHRFLGAAAAAGASVGVVERLAGTAGLPASFPLVRVRSSASALAAGAAWVRANHRVPVVAVTGSNGKTTVKDLLAALLRRATGGRESAVLATRGNLNNHLGVPLTLFRLGAQHRAAVVEMGMNHAGEIGRLARLAAPHAGVILNAGRAHLGAFRSVAGVARAKGELIAALPAGGWAVLNADDPRVWAQRGRTAARVLGFGLAAGEIRAEGARLDPAGRVRFTLRTPGGSAAVRTRLPGVHNAANAAAAAAVAWAFGMDEREIASVLGRFRPAMRMRLERRRLPGGAIAVVDCYNANPDSCRAAFAYLRGLKARRPILVLGAMRELGTHAARAHRAVGAEAAGLEPGLIVGVGPGAQPLVEGARAAGATTALWTPDAPAAADAVAGALRPGVLALFKASRRMELERLVARLIARRRPRAV